MDERSVCKCASCPMSGRVYVSSRGAARPRLFVIGQNPGKTEAETGKPFKGTSGQLARAAVGRDLPEEDVRWGNVVGCSSVRSEGIKFDAPSRCCLPRIKAEIVACKPRAILLFGDVASKALVGSAVSTCRHRWFNAVAGVPTLAFATYHPAYVLDDRTLDATWLADVHRACVAAKTGRVPGTKVVTPIVCGTVAEARDLIDRAHSERMVGFDLETTGLHPMKSPVPAAILAVGFAGPDWCGSIPWDHPDRPLRTAGLLRSVKQLLQNRSRVKVVHNAKFEMLWTGALWQVEPHPVLDSLVVHAFLQPELPRSVSDIAWTYGIGGYDEHIEPMKDRMWEVPWDKLCTYNGLDCRVAYDHALSMVGRLSPLQRKTYDEIIMPGSELLAKMEMRGIAFSLKALQDTVAELRPKFKSVDRDLHAVCGAGFNPRSSPQVNKWFYGAERKKKCPVLAKTKAGNPSLASEVLERLAEQGWKEAQLLITWRQLDSIVNQRSAELTGHVRDGFIYTLYTQMETVSGRLSSRDPNLQNQAVRGEAAKVRRAFVSRFKNGVLIEPDAGQMELRAVASLAQDREMCRLFNEGKDLHREAARIIYALSDNAEVSDDQRSQGKRANFAATTEVGPDRFAREYGVTPMEAVRFLKRYRKRFRDITNWKFALRDRILKEGRVHSVYGRLRVGSHASKRHASDASRMDSYRSLLSFLIQSPSSDMFLSFGLAVERRLRERNLRAVVIHLVHDSALVDAPPNEEKAVRAIMAEAREETQGNSRWYIVPFVIDLKVGPNWYDVKKQK